MKLSIIIAATRPAYLYWTLRSLFLQIRDVANLDYEILVIDDGDDKRCRKITQQYAKRSYPIRYIFTGQRHTNGFVPRGVGYVLNIGAQQATGEIILLTQDGIFQTPGCFRSVINATMKDRTAIATPLVKGDDGRLIEFLLANKKDTDLMNNLQLKRIIHKLLPLRIGATLWPAHRDMPFYLALSRQAYIDIGGTDEDFYGYCSEDNDLMQRLVKSGLHYEYVDGVCFHLFHGIGNSKKVVASERFKYNRRLMNERKETIIRNVGRQWGMVHDTQPPQHLARLYLTMCVTTKCNQSCPLCSQKRVMEEHDKYEMSQKELRYFIASCQKRNIKFSCIKLTGGEPTLWSMFAKGAKELKESGICDEVTFITNGSNPKLATRVSQLYAPWYFISTNQATKKQLAIHLERGILPLLSNRPHVIPPENAQDVTLPCQCDATTTRWGETVNQLLYLRGKMYYCHAAAALSYLTPPDPKIRCSFDDDFVSKFRNKKFDREICRYCVDNKEIRHSLQTGAKL